MDTTTTHNTFKYKLYPTPHQQARMEFVLRRCRELYNAALQERRDAWQKCRTSIHWAHQHAELPAIKAVRPEYHDVHSQVLQDVLTRLDRAFQAFFRRVQAGEKPGYPRFQRGIRYHSFTYKQFGNGTTLKSGDLVLSKIGRIPVRWSRPLEGTIKAVTVTKEPDGWYVCFACEEVPTKPLPPTRTILSGKAAYAGRRVIAVPSAYTSQDCSGCGERVEKCLSVRTHICPSCGLVLDRDETQPGIFNGPGRPFGGSLGYWRGRTEHLPQSCGESVNG